MPGIGQGLDKQVLKVGLKNLFQMLKGLTDADDIDNKMIEGLANVIEEYVKTGKVITAGTAAAQQGTIT